MTDDVTLSDLVSDLHDSPDPRDFIDRMKREHPHLAEDLERHAELIQLVDDAVAEDMVGVPTQLGPYRIIDFLARGGMGCVYLAQQESPLRRFVCLKVLSQHIDTPDTRIRFDLERESLSRMDHPHIARVFDAGATGDGRPFVVMEFVDGPPITEYCEAHGLDLEARLQLFAAVCDAVGHAHQKGVIHRDVKPSNVLVAEIDGYAVPKVIDFGLAKHTSAGVTQGMTVKGQILGTPAYMSPEQAGGADIDVRTDVYGLGVLLYELLVGDGLWGRESESELGAVALIRRVLEEDPVRPSTRLSTPHGTAITSSSRIRVTDLRGDLDWIVMKALEKEPDRRYGNAREMAEDVRRHLAYEPVAAGPPKASYRARKFLRRHRVAALGAAAVLASLVGGLILSLFLYRETEDARQSAVAAAADEATARAAAEEAEAHAMQSLDDKVREAAKASAIRDLLLELLVAARPGYQGASARLIDVLDVAEARLAMSPAADPATVAALRHALGLTRLRLGQPGVAIGHLRKSLEFRASALGETNADTRASRLLLVEALLEASASDDAREVFDRLEDTTSPRALALDARLAVAEGRLDVADALYARLLQGAEASPQSVAARLGHAVVLSAKGRGDDAAGAVEQAHRDAVHVLLPDDPVYNQAQLAWARLLIERGDLQTAANVAARVAASVESAAGPRHPQVLSALELQAHVFARSGDTRHLESTRAQIASLRDGPRETSGEAPGPLQAFPQLRHLLEMVNDHWTRGQEDRAWALLLQGQRLLEASMDGESSDSVRTALSFWLGSKMASNTSSDSKRRECLDRAIQHLDALLISRPGDFQARYRRLMYRWEQLTLDWKQGDRPSAIAKMETELQWMHDLAEEHSASTEALRLLARCQMAFVDLALRGLRRNEGCPLPRKELMRLVDEAIALYEEALPHASGAALRGTRCNLGIAHLNRAAVLKQFGEFRAADAAYESAIAVARELLEDGMLSESLFISSLEESVALMVLVPASLDLARLEMHQLGDVEEAMSRLRWTVEYLERIGPTVQDRAEWSRLLLAARTHFAHALSLRGEFGEAARQQELLSAALRAEHARKPTEGSAQALFQVEFGRAQSCLDRGELERGRAIATELVTLAAALVQAHDSPSNRWCLGTAHLLVAEYDRTEEQWERAIDGYASVIEILAEILGDRPIVDAVRTAQGANVVMNLGVAHSHRGVSLSNLGRHAEALEALKEQRKLHGAIVESNPQALAPRQCLAVCYAWLATTADEMGRPDDAERFRRQQLDLDMALRRGGLRVVRPLSTLGQLLRSRLDADDLEGVEAFWQKILTELALFESAEARDPVSIRRHASDLRFIANLGRRLGRLPTVEPALLALREAMSKIEEGTADLPDEQQFREAHADVERWIAWARASNGRAPPQDPDEHLARAYALRWEGASGRAVEHFREALKDAEIREDIQQAHRFRAAGAAARAASALEGGEEAERLRATALDWLHADLTYRRGRPDDPDADLESDEERDFAREAFRRHLGWVHSHPDFQDLADNAEFLALFR